MSVISSLLCQHLDYTFEKDEYARVRANSERPLEYIIFVHDILYEDGCADAKSYHLMVTKYSFLRSTHPFSGRENEAAISNRELLLHFGDFDKMGTRDDAEVMRLDDIAYAKGLTSGFEISSDSVDHVVRPPSRANNFWQKSILMHN
jgi:hypothetical protein